MRPLRSLRVLAYVLIVLAHGILPASAQDDSTDPPCCQERAIVVPIVAYSVDIGLPVSLLFIFAFSMRHRHAAKAAAEPEAERSAPKAAARGRAATVLDMPPPEEAPPAAGLKAAAVKCLATVWTGSSNKTDTAAENSRSTELRLDLYASMPIEKLLATLGSKAEGLDADDAAKRLVEHGENAVVHQKPPSVLVLAAGAVFQPFNALMLVVAILTACPPNSSYPTFALIMILLGAAIVLRFYEEVKGCRLTAEMAAAASATARVVRGGAEIEIDVRGVVPGDVVRLSAGYLIPGDARLLESTNLFVGMSSLTGEAMPVEKRPLQASAKETVLHMQNLCLMNTFVVSGNAKAVVVGTGTETYVACVAKLGASSGRRMTAFDRAVRRIVFVFIAFIVVMVPIVIVISGMTAGDWSGAVSFGLAVAVGLTPQMLPMIVQANLALSVRLMRKHKTAIKRMDAVQNLGAMDVLCTDKTGTLTVDEVTLLKSLDVDGNESRDVLKLAYANSHFQAGLPNLLDKGVLKIGRERQVADEVIATWKYISELPFDFERRMLSVVVRRRSIVNRHPLIICKGALEELLACCDRSLDADGTHCPLDEAGRAAILARGRELNEEGLRVVGLATKDFTRPLVNLDREDEKNMLFRGFLAFLDPPKASAIPSIAEFKDKGIAIKVLTGDSLPTAKRLCREMGIDTEFCTTGAELLEAEKEEAADLIRRCTVFAKVTPQQKMQVVMSLQKAGRIVGFLGDGTNDALALRQADVGISVDSGTDVAKEAADMVMLGKDLATICEGVLIGRKTYGNTIKYIKFASSSSFGNTFSILAAAAWLPYTPLQAIQVLALNVLYNISQLAIPWDNMDPDFLKKPKAWNAGFLGIYMLIIGPISSIFDITTFLILWFIFGVNSGSPEDAITMQTAWFIESLMTQTFIVHLLRTERVPFFESMAAWPLLLSSFGTMAAGVAICYIPGLNAALALQPPIPSYFAYLAATVAAYCVCTQIIKRAYIRVFNNWL